MCINIRHSQYHLSILEQVNIEIKTVGFNNMVNPACCFYVLSGRVQ